MTNKKKITANQANALKSTGPRTTEGKAIASQNAVKHGILSKAAIVEGEAIEVYEAFRTSIFDDLQPIGAMEQLLAEKIAHCSWRLRRSSHAEAQLFGQKASNQYNPTAVLDLFSGLEAQKLHNLFRYESALEKHFYRSLKELQQLQALRKQREHEKNVDEMFGFGFVS